MNKLFSSHKMNYRILKLEIYIVFYLKYKILMLLL